MPGLEDAPMLRLISAVAVQWMSCATPDQLILRTRVESQQQIPHKELNV